MKIGVIGAGTMGQGIAKAFAQVEGNTVALCDIKQEWAENGLAKIKKGYEKLVAKGKMTQEKADAIVAAITPGLKEDLCADCDLIVEAAFEDMKVKQTTFGELDAICKPECIFASNTSSLSITEIGKNVKRPVVGMHFFNPADRMKLIEVIAGCNTPAETVEKIKEISVAIGKSPVHHVQDGAAACRVHPAHRKAEQPRHGFHIHPDHFLFPGVVGLQIAAAHAKARVVDKDINGLPLQLLEKALAVLFLCKIGRQDAAGRAQFCGQRFQPVGAAGGQDEPAAQLCIAACKLLPDAGACASDPDGLLHGDFPFSSRPQSGDFLYLLPLF